MTTSTAPGPRLYFLPEDLDLERLPEGVRMALREIVEPAYAQLILGAPDALERAAGASFVHALYLEILDQADLGQQVAVRLARGTESALPHIDHLNRHFRLAQSKERAGAFLLKLRNFRAMHGIPVVMGRHSELDGARDADDRESGKTENG